MSLDPIVITIIAAVGLVLVRGRWARHLGIVLTAGVLAVTAVAASFSATVVANGNTVDDSTTAM